jgi:hypothetical protein
MGMDKKLVVPSDEREESVEEHLANTIAGVLLFVIAICFFVGLYIALNMFAPIIIKLFS